MVRTSFDRDNRPPEDPINKQGKMFTWGTPMADKKFTPIASNHFCLFAGSESSGKTAYTFALAAVNASSGYRVLFMSLEMPTGNILTRVARSYAGIRKEQWRDKTLITDTQRQAYYKKRQELESQPNLILVGFEDGKPTTLNNIFDIILNIKPDLVILDNFDLVDKEGQKDIQAQDRIAKGFMDFTNQKKIPIIVVHHIKKTKDKMTSDAVRGSGKITDCADSLFMCSRNKEDAEVSALEKAEFIVGEKKDREFGEGGLHIFYFHKGGFYDDFKGKRQPGF